MLKWVRAAVIILFVATVLWANSFFLSLQDYRRYVKDYYEKCEQEKQRALEEHGLHVDFWMTKSYREWNSGGITLLFGFLLLCAWITVILKRKNAQEVRKQ